MHALVIISVRPPWLDMQGLSLGVQGWSHFFCDDDMASHTKLRLEVHTLIFHTVCIVHLSAQEKARLSPA